MEKKALNHAENLRQVTFVQANYTVRILVRENLNFKGYEKKNGPIPDFCTGDLKRL